MFSLFARRRKAPKAVLISLGATLIALLLTDAPGIQAEMLKVQTQAKLRVVPSMIAVRAPVPPLALQKQIAALPPSVVDRAKDEFGKNWMNVLQKSNFDQNRIPFRRWPWPIFFVPPRVMQANQEPCYYRNAFFNKNVMAVVGNDPSGQEISQYGEYYTGLDVSRAGTYYFSATCEDQFASGTLTTPNSQHLDHPPIVFANHLPAIASFKAQVSGADVVAAPPGTVVNLVLSASDADNDALQLTWRVGSGAIVAINGNTAQWRLPASGGLNFGYVLVYDVRGGYREAGVVVSTDAASVVNGASNAAIVPAPAPGANPAPSDHVRSGDHFLTYFSTNDLDAFNGQGADTALSACRYYEAIHAVGGCGPNGELLGQAENFTQWKTRWGLDAPGSGVSASYANIRDLNLEREMHGNSNAAGTAFYVCNYPFANDPGFNNVTQQKNLVACVAMEYSPTPGVNNGQPYTKFLVYGPSGDLLSSANLDARGEKYLPGVCVVCHGASESFVRYDEHGRSSPALGAQFLPFDLHNYRFPSSGPLSQPSQEGALRSLNNLVLTTAPAQPISELIHGWYPTPTSNFTDAYVPPGWAGHEPLYNDLVKDNCRTCHVAMSPGNATVSSLSFQSFDQFNARNYSLARRVCGLPGQGVPRKRWSMPNSKVTFDGFWTKPSAVQALQNHLLTQGAIPAGTTCSLPNF